MSAVESISVSFFSFFFECENSVETLWQQVSTIIFNIMLIFNCCKSDLPLGLGSP